MKLTTGILIIAMAAGAAQAQNTNVIDKTRSTMNSVQQKQQNDSDAALNITPAPAARPSATTSAKPVVAKPIAAKSATAAPQKPTAHAAAAPQVARAHAKSSAPKLKAANAVKSSAPKTVVAVEDKKNPEAKKEQAKAINLTGRRDPFISPVVNRSMVGSGCSTGKKCLAIDQISLKGVVKADQGMIAVVTNAVNKAYFLHENDPVFNGYVVKITGDSIIFKETVQDRLGKPFTHEVTKKITTPAV
jgi:Tfp pilus assembly protein PilP